MMLCTTGYRNDTLGAALSLSLLDGGFPGGVMARKVKMPLPSRNGTLSISGAWNAEVSGMENITT